MRSERTYWAGTRIWHHWLHPGFSVHYSFLPWAPEGNQHGKMRLPPSRLKSTVCLHVVNLVISLLQTSQGSEGLGRISWPAPYLELLQWVRRILYFQGKGEAKRFPESPSTLPQTNLPCYLWRVVEISTPIVSRVPLQFNFHGDLSQQFCWSCKCFSPTYLYAFSSNHVWNLHTRYNCQDNTRPCKP